MESLVVFVKSPAGEVGRSKLLGTPLLEHHVQFSRPLPKNHMLKLQTTEPAGVIGPLPLRPGPRNLRPGRAAVLANVHRKRSLHGSPDLFSSAYSA